MAKSNLTHRIALRLSEEEYEILQKGCECDSRKLSEFIRHYTVKIAKKLIAEEKQLEVMQQSSNMFSMLGNLEDLKELEKE